MARRVRECVYVCSERPTVEWCLRGVVEVVYCQLGPQCKADGALTEKVPPSVNRRRVDGQVIIVEGLCDLCCVDRPESIWMNDLSDCGKSLQYYC